MADAPYHYPPAPPSAVKETLHGVEIADPYRGLEDIDSAPTRAWVEAQAQFTNDYLAKLPQRADIAQRLTKLMDYDRLGLPVIEAGRVFFTRKTGLQNQAVLFWKKSAEAAPEVLLDPNTLTKDGTAALTGWEVNRQGALLVYGISLAGSDWTEWKVREVATGKDLPDVLTWIKFSHPRWNQAGDALYYSRYAAPAAGQDLKQKNENQRLFLHPLGKPVADDPLLYARPDHPQWMLSGGETEDARYLVIHISNGAAGHNALFYKDLRAGAEALVVELRKDFDAKYQFEGNDASTFYITTTKDAPNQRLIALDLAKPAPSEWKTILAEGKSLLSSVSYLGGKFIATRLVDAHDAVSVHDKSGQLERQIQLPGLVSAHGFAGHATDTVTSYIVTGFTTPGEIYRYDLTSSTSTLTESTKVAFTPADYETSQAFYASKDGTQIPMFLCHRQGLAKDGQRPVLLTGYGGFDISLTPAFAPSIIAWMDLGGVFAQPNLRGGGEYGQAWHDAGRRLLKQNVFDDFIAAGEWLIAQGYTNAKRLAISGGSNGGTLVAACLNQRPELFGAALPAVGVQDMLRFHKFTIGWAWQDEYGSPDDAEAFANLRKYSPLHNVRPVAYPPTMILTGDHDDRVFPAHSFKYAATLQSQQRGPAPILLRVDLRAGHGAGKPTAKQIDETADKYAFLVQALGMSMP